MKKLWLLFAPLSFAAIGMAVAAGATPPQGTTTISLPTGLSPAFRPGAGVELAQTYCVTCHSSAYVATQPPLSAAQWTAEVTKMQHVYGAPIPPEAVAPLVQYLTAQYGKK